VQRKDERPEVGDGETTSYRRTKKCRKDRGAPGDRRRTGGSKNQGGVSAKGEKKARGAGGEGEAKEGKYTLGLKARIP